MLQTKVKKKNVQDYLPSKVPLAMSTQMAAWIIRPHVTVGFVLREDLQIAVCEILGLNKLRGNGDFLKLLHGLVKN